MRLVFAPPPDSSSDAARVTTRERGRWAKHLALENVPVFGSAATARARALVDAADAEAAQRGAVDARAVDVACMVLVGLHVPSRRVECGRHPRVARKISEERDEISILSRERRPRVGNRCALSAQAVARKVILRPLKAPSRWQRRPSR
jgi:hypothetical protein